VGQESVFLKDSLRDSGLRINIYVTERARKQDSAVQKEWAKVGFMTSFLLKD
jgi:hypothetical protein